MQSGRGTTRLTCDSANRLTQRSFTAEEEDAAPRTTLYGWDTANAWRTSQGPQADPARRPVQMTYTAQGRLATYADAATATTATYTYDGAGQRTRKVVTVAGTTTTTSFAYEELTLLSLSAPRATRRGP